VAKECSNLRVGQTNKVFKLMEHSQILLSEACYLELLSFLEEGLISVTAGQSVIKLIGNNNFSFYIEQVTFDKDINKGDTGNQVPGLTNFNQVRRGRNTPGADICKCTLTRCGERFLS
jgi:hypothetical protein